MSSQSYDMLMVMEPYQSPGSMPPTQNPYDFITNPGQPQKQSMMGGSSMRKRILIVAGGVLLLVIIASIAASLISSAGNADVNALKSLVAEQQEIIRVATLGDNKTQDDQVGSFGTITKMSVTTQQQKLTAYLESRGVKVNKVEIAAKKKDSTDKELEAATTSNHFDEVYKAKLSEAMLAYTQNLQDTYNTTPSQKAKDVLAESYESNVALLGIKKAE